MDKPCYWLLLWTIGVIEINRRNERSISTTNSCFKNPSFWEKLTVNKLNVSMITSDKTVKCGTVQDDHLAHALILFISISLVVNLKFYSINFYNIINNNKNYFYK